MNIIINDAKCTGCTACHAVCPKQAISLNSDSEGFFQPYIDHTKCISCGRCQTVCPVNNVPEVSSNSIAYAAYNLNEESRQGSSSGGIFSLIAEWVLENKGVVFGAAYDKYQKVNHISIINKEDLKKLRGAKYVQSDLKDTFTQAKKYLLEEKIVLFSGTPCQIAGLKKYLVNDYNNLFTMDIVCHGVPSPMVWEEYLEYRKKEDRQNTIANEINMRAKSSGWSRYNYSILFRYESGYEYVKKNNDDYYMQGFINNYFLRESCYECLFKGVERCSDFTLGDFWGIWDYYPLMDDNKGTSMVLIHTEKARRLWNAIRNKCKFVSVDEDKTFKQNPSLVRNSCIYKNRVGILVNIKEEGFKKIENEINKNQFLNETSQNKITLFSKCKHLLKKLIY